MSLSVYKSITYKIMNKFSRQIQVNLNLEEKNDYKYMLEVTKDKETYIYHNSKINDIIYKEENGKYICLLQFETSIEPDLIERK